MSFGLPRPLQTPFELKVELPTSSFTPDAATLTLHALNLLKRPKTSKIFVSHFPPNQKLEISKSGGLKYTFKILL